MKFLFAIALTLAVASSKASLLDDLKTDAESIEDTITDAFDDMKNDVVYLMQRLKHFLQSLVDEKRIELEQIAEFAVQQVELDMTLNQHCKEQVKQKIQTSKSSGIANFFSCSNLTDAMVESGSVIVFSLELTVNLTSNFNAIFGRLNGCSSKSFYEKPVCWFNAVTAVKSDIEKDMKDIAFFKTKVAKLINDINANVNYCINPTKTTLTAAVEHALTSSKDCKPANPIKAH